MIAKAKKRHHLDQSIQVYVHTSQKRRGLRHHWNWLPATGIRRIKEQYIGQDEKPKFLVSENAVVVVLPYVMEVRKHDYNSKIVKDKSGLYGNEKIIYDLISHNPGIKRASIQSKIDLEKSQTIEVLNKLRIRNYIVERKWSF